MIKAKLPFDAANFDLCMNSKRLPVEETIDDIGYTGREFVELRWSNCGS
jgi:hypothetical protein